jgi:hypothetical protein
LLVVLLFRPSLLSIFIDSVLILAARFFVPSFAAAFGAIFGVIGNGLEILAGKLTANSAILLNIILMLSTLMTSVWTGLVMTATIVLKGTGPLNYTIRVSRWMFDVDAHPVRVIGLVSAAIVWAGSGVYGLL